MNYESGVELKNKAKTNALRAAVRVACIQGVLASTLLVGPLAHSADAPTTVPVGFVTPITFDIPAQSLETALLRFSEQARIQVVVANGAARGAMSPQIKGELSAAEALQLLLKESALTYEVTDERTIAIRAGTQNGGFKAISHSTVAPAHKTTRVAQAETADVPGPSAMAKENGESSSAPSETLEEIVVTGTNIRGVAPAGSATMVFSREDIERTGSATVAQFLERIPQNFTNANAVISPYTSSDNIGRGNGVNLRGIGTRTTLTLVNGRRMGLSGLGTMADISMIPVGAIERVEVLSDGASAVYGSDAVAGVVNIVLRKNYSGAESHVRTESRLNGDSRVYVADQAFGTAWSSGSATFSLGFQRDEPIRAVDRDYTNTGAAHDLTPKQTRYSGTAALRQQVGERLELFIDGHYGIRETNAWGQLQPSGPVTHALIETDQINVSAGLDYSLTADWSLKADVAHGYDSTDSDGSFGRDQYKSRVLGVRAMANGPLLSLDAGEVKMAIGVEARRERNRRTSSSLDSLAPTRPLSREVDSAFLELSVPIAKTLTASLAGRHEKYSDFGSTTNPKLGLSWHVTPEFELRGAFSRSFSVSRLSDSLTAFNAGSVDLVAGSQCAAGQCLVLSEYGARDTYDPERAKTYNIGLDYSPQWAQGLSLQASYYRISYTDRIGRLPDQAFMLSAGEYFPEVIVEAPTGDFIQNQIDRMTRAYWQGVYNWVGPYDVNDFDYFIDWRTTNLSESKTEGIDLSLKYSWPWAGKTLGFEVAGTYILDYTNTAFPTSPQTPGVNRVGLPSDLKLNASLSLNAPGYNASLWLRHTGDYIDDRELQAVPVGSWTTADLHVMFPLGQRFGGRADGLEASITVRNLFDRDPPVVTGYGGLDLGFDPANANPEGRVVGIDVRKRW